MDVWRLVIEGMATLHELETTWSLDDIERAIAVLDIKSEIESIVSEEARKKMGNK